MLMSEHLARDMTDSLQYILHSLYDIYNATGLYVGVKYLVSIHVDTSVYLSIYSTK